MTIIEGIQKGSLFLLLPAWMIHSSFCRLGVCSSDGEAFDRVCTLSNPIPVWVFWWLVVEAVFFVAMQGKLAYLQSMDPQESYLKAARIQTAEERQLLWDRVMKADAHDAVGYFESWFFDSPLEEISVEEFRDFVAWGFFDNRNQEHLTEAEKKQLEVFVNDALDRIRVQKSRTTSRPSTSKLARAATFVTKASSSSSDDDESMDDSLPCASESNPTKLVLYQNLLKNVFEKSHNIPHSEVAKIMRETTKLSREQQKIPNWRFGRPTADPILGSYIC